MNILITAAGGFSHGSSILHALSLSSLKLKIHGADMSKNMLQTVACDHKILTLPASHPDYLNHLQKICHFHQIEAIFTGSENELDYFSEAKANNLPPILKNKEETVRLCKHKLLCTKHLQEAGFDVPTSRQIYNEKDLIQEKSFPLILKPIKDSGASANVYVVDNKAEFHRIAMKLLSQNLEIMVQDYIPFEENEYTVGVTSDFDGNVCGVVILKKIFEGATLNKMFRKYPISTGITQGYILEESQEPLIRKVCTNIAQSLDSRGPLNIQLRKWQGKVFPFEINPRFSGTTSARAMSGYNEPEFYLKLLMGDKNAKESLHVYKPGLFTRGLREVFTPLSDIQI